MRSLCFGGSFNPIHHGHLICARAAAEAGGFDGVTLIPSAQPPHKTGSRDMAAAEHRLAMCQLAALNHDLLRVHEIEIQRGGTSYTIDTVRALMAMGWDKVSWLIGADMLLHLPKWHDPESLLKEVDFVVMARPGFEIDWSTLPPEFRVLQANVVQTPRIEISSTQIRQRVSEGKSIAWLMPERVCEYIQRMGLYQT